MDSRCSALKRLAHADLRFMSANSVSSFARSGFVRWSADEVPIAKASYSEELGGDLMEETLEEGGTDLAGNPRVRARRWECRVVLEATGGRWTSPR
jgi:hypothetical protein